jgi:hypothetical protein
MALLWQRPDSREIVMQPATDSDIVTALFQDAADTERAFDAVLERGYEPDEINLLMSEETRQHRFATGRVGTVLAAKARQSTGADKPAGLDEKNMGGPVGGTMGTLAPAAAAVGTVLLLPGLIFAGPVAVALAAAGAVGVAGGVIGALTHWGIPSARIEDYEAQIREGGILMGVKPHSAEDGAWLRQAWREAGGTLVQ